MAFRYLAIVEKSSGGAVGSAFEKALHVGLPLLFSTHGLFVFGDLSDKLLANADTTAVIVGQVFQRAHKPAPITAFGEISTSDVSPASLLRTVWGSYIAVTREEQGVSILRDPSGGLPCYWYETNDSFILSSDIETMCSVLPKMPEIDWFALRNFLAGGGLPDTRTCLAGVHELPPGFVLRTGIRGGQLVPAWNPWDFTSPNAGLPGDLSDEMFHTVRSSIGALSTGYRKILLSLSGGLDSSIIAASLAGSSNVHCLTMSTDEGIGDERHYAAQVANTLGMPLEEAFYDVQHVDITKTSSAHLPRPLGQATGQSYVYAHLHSASANGADAFFNGHGGDNVFCLTQSAVAIVDRLRAEGVFPGLQRTFKDLCQLTGCSVWSAARGALELSLKPASYVWQSNPRFVSAANIVQPESPYPRLWLEAPDDALPGKAAHISKILRTHGTLDAGFSRHGLPPQVFPLLAQPIMELALKIPTWRWIEGGQNRSIVRMAFVGHLPETIIRRRSKGGPTSFASEIIEANMSVVRGLLIDGLLAANGIIDRQSVIAATSNEAPLKSVDRMQLTALAEAETWARHWARPNFAI